MAINKKHASISKHRRTYIVIILFSVVYPPIFSGCTSAKLQKRTSECRNGVKTRLFGYGLQFVGRVAKQCAGILDAQPIDIFIECRPVFFVEEVAYIGAVRAGESRDIR